MDGIHLLGEWYGCAAAMPEMTRAEPLRALCLRLSEASGMTIVGDRFFQFEPQGVRPGSSEIFRDLDSLTHAYGYQLSVGGVRRIGVERQTDDGLRHGTPSPIARF